MNGVPCRSKLAAFLDWLLGDEERERIYRAEQRREREVAAVEKIAREKKADD